MWWKVIWRRLICYAAPRYLQPPTAPWERSPPERLEVIGRAMKEMAGSLLDVRIRQVRLWVRAKVIRGDFVEGEWAGIFTPALDTDSLCHG